jgi:HD-GYP domain-containing protein (c-di-GMP phosphodiesterase class II)
VYGAQVLSNLPAITETVLQIVLYHHERWDGTGYPEGLKGDHIPLAARFVSIVDVYTSLRAKRTYKPSLNRYEASLTIKRMAGLELDPEMTQDFLRFIGMV